MAERPDGACLRLRVLLRNGALAQWLGQFLLALDRSDGIALQLQRLETDDASPSPSFLSGLWHARIPALAPWLPDEAARQRLAHWETAAHGACDVTLLLDAGLSRRSAQTCA